MYLKKGKEWSRYYEYVKPLEKGSKIESEGLKKVNKKPRSMQIFGKPEMETENPFEALRDYLNFVPPVSKLGDPFFRSIKYNASEKKKL